MGTPLLPTFSACVFPHIFCFLFLHSSQTTSFFQLYQKHNLTPMCVVILTRIM